MRYVASPFRVIKAIKGQGFGLINETRCNMTKYIFVTGGVVSSLGKGITAASLGRLLKSRGYKITIEKFDPYINIDPGTMSPYQHGEVLISERHRHRWEFNNIYKEALTGKGLRIGGTSPDGKLVEIIELDRALHPWFVGVQFHPEFKSRPTRPHPLFRDFVVAGIDRAKTK